MECHQCPVEGCTRKVHPQHTLCPGHERRRQKGKPLEVELRPWGEAPSQRLAKAALQYAEAEEDWEYNRCWRRLLEAALAYTYWRRPRGKG